MLIVIQNGSTKIGDQQQDWWNAECAPLKLGIAPIETFPSFDFQETSFSNSTRAQSKDKVMSLFGKEATPSSSC